MRLLHRAALAVLLALPAFLMHGRGIADTLLVLIDLAFLARCALARDWDWARRSWMLPGLLWWGWLVLCSVPGLGIGGWLSLGHALAALRFLVFVAALERWLLCDPSARSWLGRVLTLSALYIALSSLLQFAAGRNLAGWPRGPEGELTGPFKNPRAGAPLSRLLFPILLPALHRLRAGAPARQAGAFALAAGSVGTMVLIGQRMPLVLTAFGLVVSGLMLPRLRKIVLAAFVAGGLMLAASAAVSPPTWHRLVQKFSTQMADFPDSDYGLIFRRAVAITAEHPLLGRGYGGFRNACPVGGGGLYCNIHPHNHYLEAATDAGLPGLLLFCALVFAWLRGLARHLGQNPDPLRVGLFVAALVQEWPLASASSFFAIEIAGFFLVMLGWGLAEARYSPASTASTGPSAARPST